MLIGLGYGALKIIRKEKERIWGFRGKKKEEGHRVKESEERKKKLPPIFKILIATEK